MKRALNIHQIRAYRPTTLPFDGEWLDAIGTPELTGSWIVWGQSGNGKTRFALLLAKYLCQFGKVAYDSLEEGLSLSMQRAIGEVGFADCKTRFVLLDKEPIADLRVRLRRQRAPRIIIIDSVQYTGMSYADYKQLREDFPTKLFIYISHAAGNLPAGMVAGSIRYDAMVKISVQNYVAYCQSRYGGGAPLVVWREGAERAGVIQATGTTRPTEQSNN